MYRRFFHTKYLGRRYLALFAVLAGLVAALYFAGHYTYEFFFYRGSFDGILKDAGARHGIDYRLLKAVVWRESRFNQNARGRLGEIGLMQIRKEYSAEDWSRVNKIPIASEGILFNPSMNIEVGAWYLSRAFKRWKGYDHNVELALSEYNAGYGGMKKWLPADPAANIVDNISSESAKDYIVSIVEKYNEYLSEQPVGK
jgi:soluble lytic murein transglycosylase